MVMSAPLVRLLEYDSAFWGIRMYETAWPALVSDAEFIQTRMPVDELPYLLPVGFQPVDVRVTLDRPLDRRPPVSIEEIRAYQDTDLEALIQIARGSHHITRFYADPGFPDERCDDYYETWIRNSVDGWADAVLVAGRPTHGYVTVHLDGQTASIGLIAVDEQARGQGIGQRLCNGAFRWAHAAGAKRMTVVTQGRNIAAQRLFQRCGFRTTSTAIWLHKHFR